ncbi:MAG TPA: sodium:proton antiporter, partial [Humibacter sp.]|nr:sodium:proton antiporter [Humibacter sp.]
PSDTPQRSVLVLIAFAVAAFSLLLQGGTIGPLVRMITPKVDQTAVDKQNDEERTKIMELMRKSAQAIPEPPRPEGEPTVESFREQRKYRLAVLEAQRAELLDARDNGIFDADVLESLLANLDASQIAMEMRGSRA